MCFILDRPNQRVKIAKKNIVCWKLLTKLNISYHQNYKYEYDVIQPKVKLIIDNIDRDISEGYHSYITEKYANDWKDSLIVKKFIIPKGTRYYVSKDYGEYVSETIKMIKS